MNCSQCGTELNLGDKFCPQCGYSQIMADRDEILTANAAPALPGIKRKKVIVVLLVTMLVLLAGFIGTYAVKSRQISSQIDLGNKYLADGNYDQAILAYNEAVTIDPKNIPARVGIARCSIQSGDGRKADAALETLQQTVGYENIAPKDLQTLIDACITVERYDLALEILTLSPASNKNEFMTRLQEDLTRASKPVEFEWIYGDGESDASLDGAVQLSDGSFALIMNYTNRATKKQTANLVNLDLEQNIRWSREIGKYASDLISAADGGFIFVRRDFQQETTELVKVDDDAQEQWSTALKGNGCLAIFCLLSTPDGGWIVAGNTCERIDKYDLGPSSNWIARIDSEGVVVWENIFGDRESINHIEKVGDGTYIALISRGWTGIQAGSSIEVVRLDGQGQIVQTAEIDHESMEDPSCFCRLSNGEYIIGVNGHTVDNNHLLPAYWLTRIDSEGKTIKETRLGEYIMDVAPCRDGGYVVASSDLTSDFGHHISKYTADDALEWQSYALAGQTIKQTADGGYILFGSMYMGIGSSNLPYICKMDSRGQYTPARIYD